MYDELYNPTSFEWGNITDKEEIIRILNTYIDNYFDVSGKEIWFNKVTKNINHPLSISFGWFAVQLMEKDSSHIPKIKYTFFFPVPLYLSSMEIP